MQHVHRWAGFFSRQAGTILGRGCSNAKTTRDGFSAHVSELSCSPLWGASKCTWWQPPSAQSTCM
eukprot:9218003-Prorocentrum_lima.AAC.1